MFYDGITGIIHRFCKVCGLNIAVFSYMDTKVDMRRYWNLAQRHDVPFKRIRLYQKNFYSRFAEDVL